MAQGNSTEAHPCVLIWDWHSLTVPGEDITYALKQILSVVVKVVQKRSPRMDIINAVVYCDTTFVSEATQDMFSEISSVDLVHALRCNVRDRIRWKIRAFSCDKREPRKKHWKEQGTLVIVSNNLVPLDDCLELVRKSGWYVVSVINHGSVTPLEVSNRAADKVIKIKLSNVSYVGDDHTQSQGSSAFNDKWQSAESSGNYAPEQPGGGNGYRDKWRSQEGNGNDYQDEWRSQQPPNGSYSQQQPNDWAAPPPGKFSYAGDAHRQSNGGTSSHDKWQSPQSSGNYSPQQPEDGNGYHDKWQSQQGNGNGYQDEWRSQQPPTGSYAQQQPNAWASRPPSKNYNKKRPAEDPACNSWKRTCQSSGGNARNRFPAAGPSHQRNGGAAAQANGAEERGPQCVHWPKCKSEFTNYECRFHHPEKKCDDFLSCIHGALLCEYGHPFCVDDKSICPCAAGQRQPEYNHRLQ